jgi:hypothetical protein
MLNPTIVGAYSHPKEGALRVLLNSPFFCASFAILIKRVGTLLMIFHRRNPQHMCREMTGGFCDSDNGRRLLKWLGLKAQNPHKVRLGISGCWRPSNNWDFSLAFASIWIKLI